MEETLLHAYYRTPEGTLRTIGALTTLAQVDEVIEDVTTQLNAEGEPYLKPVLVLIKGGKS